MKSIYFYIKEEGEGAAVSATPGNTMGMGNPISPGENGEPGSEPIPTAKVKKQKRRKSLKESLLDDEDDLVNNDNNVLIEQFLKDNYKIEGTYTIKNNIVDVTGNVDVKNKRWFKNLTNDLFSFGEITGSLYLYDCKNLKSLKGGPKKIGGSLICSGDINLTSLEGIATYIGGNLNCNHCKSLKNLIFFPEIIKGNVYINYCSSLEYLNTKSKEIYGDFSILNCNKLKSLDGLPRMINGNLFYSYNKNLDKTYINTITVNRKIYEIK